MNCGLFGVRFSVLWHKKGAVAPVDYLSTFATAPFDFKIDKNSSAKNRIFLLSHCVEFDIIRH